MVYFPARKCYHAAKVAILVLFVVAVLALFEQWRGGKRGTVAYSNPEEAEFERQILEDEARIVPGLGEGGVAAYLTGEDKKRGEESEKKLAMNVYLSDRIAYNRTLKDHRNPACKRVIYDAELPSASVILIFHNEPYSVVVRTIWSVINSCRRSNKWFRQANFVDRNGRNMQLGYPGQDPNSPLVYLKEIILVDDNSTLPELKGKLSHYVRTRLPPDLIRILRLPDRVGLTRARLAGARYAAADVLVFLDSHCEAQLDWLRPQLQAIKDAPHAVTVPIIDVIDSSNFYYSVQDPVTFQVGGFTFTGHFTWIDIPSREKKRRGSDIAPTWSPTMAGGLFAINRAYYWELGAYDEQMAGWGGENLEMSFRIWQCGGTLETIPCSRVGHVFRSFHPYGLPEHTDTHGINTARMAEVWMDEYAELFYLHRPDLRNNPKIGDVTHRKVLREKLQCKSFQWYLDNIYKEKFVPVRDAYGYGRFQNPSTGLCLDTLQREAEEAALGLYQCHSELQATQYLILSLENELRTEDDCAHAQYKPRASREHSTGRRVLMSTCRGKGNERKFMYNPATQQIQYDEGYCLDASPGPAEDVLLRPCTNSPSQKWRIDYSEDNDFKMSNEIEPNEQQMKLSRLRGQKRISRSLLSYSAGNATVRRHTHKKRRKHARNKKTKNKFILKLVRSLTNHSEEHLEVDIHCKHRQLYPNNTLVRDLVTILNDNHIKVINNGRVFERNKVTQLTREGANAQRVLNKMDIASQQAPPPIQAIEQKPPAQQATFSLLKKGRSKLKQPPQLQPLGTGGAPPPAPPAPALGAEARAHRIIIEDFVELTPANTMRPKRMKKRKRKHPKAAPVTQPPEEPPPEEVPAEAPRANDAPEDEPMLDAPMVFEERPPAESSIEDAAMVESGAERGGARARTAEGERWDVGESRYRRNNTGWRRQRPEEQDMPAEGYAADEPVVRAQSTEGAEGEGGAEGEAPVKVVMRSNLTFNLGDEFFQWQHKDDREYTPRANDLAIPGAEEGRSPPPLHAWRLPEKPSPRAPRREREDRKESGVRNELSRTDRDSEDDSSASDTYSSGD